MFYSLWVLLAFTEVIISVCCKTKLQVLYAIESSIKGLKLFILRIYGKGQYLELTEVFLLGK